MNYRPFLVVISIHGYLLHIFSPKESPRHNWLDWRFRVTECLCVTAPIEFVKCWNRLPPASSSSSSFPPAAPCQLSRSNKSFPSEKTPNTEEMLDKQRKHLYTEWQLVKLWADMLTLFEYTRPHIFHCGIISKRITKATPLPQHSHTTPHPSPPPPIPLANTKQDMTSMSI